MTERGLPSADASPACPFVAFEDERDERADRPDHRHRCYAESEPAPRALAHQEAYCLSSAFPVCPVFQEWARREAAHTRAGGTATPTPTAATVSSAGDASGGDPDVDGSGDVEDADDWERRRDERPIEERPRRNPPRDWAAPPPWAGGVAGGAGAAAAGAAGLGGDPRQGPAPGAPDFLASRQAEGRGLAGSAADRLARDVGGRADRDDEDEDKDEPRGRPSSHHPSTGADPELAGLVRAPDRDGPRGGRDGLPPVARSGRPPTVSSTRDRDREREREKEREREHARGADGPAWEGQRRYEAYPQIRPGRSMPGMPALPRIVVLAGALAIAALALFFLPALLGVGSDDDPPVATPSASVAPTATPEPTPVPDPTAQVYVIKEGDTLTKIAQANGLTLDELLAANQDTITNPNQISIGDEIIIPVPGTDGIDGGSPSAAPSP